MSGADEKMRAVLKQIAQELGKQEERWFNNEDLDAPRHLGMVTEVLERRLLPLLLAGKAMRDSAWVNTQQRKDYDSALAAAQGQPEQPK
jgi:hypothetical protein